MALRPGLPRSSDHRYFTAAALVLVALVLAGFARTYYLRPLFTAAPLGTFLHVHGVVMSAWIAVFLVQALLVATGRVAWHRRLGIAGVALAALATVFGCLATFRAAAREVAAHSAEASARVTVLGLELTQMLMFVAFIAAGVAMRRRADYHKRFMLLATACMLPNPISRLPVSFDSNIAIIVQFDALVIAAILVDALRRRAVHPVFLWGGAALVAALHGAFVVAYSSEWHALATAWVS